MTTISDYKISISETDFLN